MNFLPVLSNHAAIFIMLALLFGDAFGRCHDRPAEYAQSMFSKLESTDNPEVLAALYSKEFSPPFQFQHPFNQFYYQLSSIQMQLGIGRKNGRVFEKRVLSGPQVVAQSSFDRSSRRQEQRYSLRSDEIRSDDLAAIDFEILTTSQAGKVRQRIQIVCIEDDWKVNGIWYFPGG